MSGWQWDKVALPPRYPLALIAFNVPEWLGAIVWWDYTRLTRREVGQAKQDGFGRSYEPRRHARNSQR